MKSTIESLRSQLTRSVIVALAVAATIATSQPARAVPIVPGDSLLGSPELKPDPFSTIVDVLVSPFVTGSYSGTVISAVLSGDTTNALGGLTFTYLLSNDATSIHNLQRITVVGFGGILTDASYNPVFPPVGVPPSLMDRSFGSGDTIGFQFVGFPLGPGFLTPGTNSQLLVVQTGVLSYSTGVANVIDGVSTSVDALVPVPEPTSLVLAALAAASLGLVVRSRRRR